MCTYLGGVITPKGGANEDNKTDKERPSFKLEGSVIFGAFQNFPIIQKLNYSNAWTCQFSCMKAKREKQQNTCKTKKKRSKPSRIDA